MIPLWLEFIYRRDAVNLQFYLWLKMTDERLDEQMKIRMIKTTRCPIWVVRNSGTENSTAHFCSATFVRKCHRSRIQYCRGERAALSGREGNLTPEFLWLAVEHRHPLLLPFSFPLCSPLCLYAIRIMRILGLVKREPNDPIPTITLKR